MGAIASRAQLRAGFWRRALVVVPIVVALGIASGRLANSGYDNAWFALLVKPAAMPPGWAFGVAWTILYAMQGFAFSMILDARGNRLRRKAIILFLIQFAINLSWSPTFFALHQVTIAFWVIVAMFVAALATTLVFGRVRPVAAWLMVPYLSWLCFAAALNNDYRQLNPQAEHLVPGPSATQMSGE